MLFRGRRYHKVDGVDARDDAHLRGPDTTGLEIILQVDAAVHPGR
jgi:hypothetical protein